MFLLYLSTGRQGLQLTVEEFNCVREIHIVLDYYVTIVSNHGQGHKDYKMISDHLARCPDGLPDLVDVLVGELFLVLMNQF